VIYPETFTAQVLSAGVIVCENWFRRLKIFVHFVEFSFHQSLTCYSRDRKNVLLYLFVEAKDEVQNVLVKSFQSRSGLAALLKISAKTNSIERKTGAEWQQTARSEQNYRHVTELICSQEGNTGSSRNPREMINPTPSSLSSGCREKLSWTQPSLLIYFPIVQKCFWCASIIS